VPVCTWIWDEMEREVENGITPERGLGKCTYSIQHTAYIYDAGCAVLYLMNYNTVIITIIHAFIINIINNTIPSARLRSSRV
jgi:hypothetical protein